jgi:hypothetical protein
LTVLESIDALEHCCQHNIRGLIEPEDAARIVVAFREMRQATTRLLDILDEWADTESPKTMAGLRDLVAQYHQAKDDARKILTKLEESQS